MKNKVLSQAGAPPLWKNQSLNAQTNETRKAWTLKDGELGQNLRVVSFVHREKNAKHRRYENFENRRI